MTTAGWQEPPYPPPCLHIELVLISMTLGSREVGDRWACGCGKLYVVTEYVSASGGTRRLEAL